MKQNPDPAKQTTAQDKVLERLRTDIVSGRFPPGTRLKIQELSARYNISPMPVREALRQLDGERLIEVSAHKGATVRLVTVKFIKDLYDVREALEGLLIENCAEGATAKEITELRALQANWEAAAVDGETAALLTANKRLHDRINQIGSNDEARTLLAGGWPLIQAFRQQIGFGKVRLDEIKSQHAALIDAIASHDPIQARQACRIHCRTARDDLVRQVEATANVTVAQKRRRILAR